MPGPVRRAQRAHLLTWLAVSFAVTVITTRVYLELTGFPSIGGGRIHLAHAVWGGALLLTAGVLPLLFAPSRVLNVSAALAGVGSGLFMDEVGKFLTSDNDYFFAPAAPLIYGTGLLLVLLVVRARRTSDEDVSQAWYGALDALGEAADSRLSRAEADQAAARLSLVASATDQPELADLATEIKTRLLRWRHLPEQRPGSLARLRTVADRADRRVVPELGYEILCALALVVLVINALIAGLAAGFLLFDADVTDLLLSDQIAGGLVPGPVARAVLLVCLLATILALTFIAISAVQRLRGRRVDAATWGIRAATVILVVVNLGASYLDISLLAVAMLLQLACLGILVRYRTRSVSAPPTQT